MKIGVKVKNALALKSKKKKGKKVKVPIVVDPRLGKKLRPHQVVGVEFVYRCMMDCKYAMNNEYGEGCILGIFYSEKLHPCTHINSDKHNLRIFLHKI